MLLNKNDPNYLLQMNAFNRWLESHYLPANAQLLWFRLIAVFNQSGWPEWAEVDTMRLMQLTGAATDKTAFRARQKLVDAGLLAYKTGRKSHPCRYRMVWFPVGSEGKTQGKTE